MQVLLTAVTVNGHGLFRFGAMARTITSLELQKNNKERVNVFLDGEYAFSLSLIRAAQLKRGQALADEEVQRLLAEDERARAYERALTYLSYRPRSQAEVERYLLQKGWSELTVREVIERLEQENLLNDREFARFWVENRERFRPRGRMALRYEMLHKGLERDIVEETLEDFDEEQSAYSLARARAKHETGLSPKEFRFRLGQYLARRGFDFSVIETVVSRLEREAGQLGDDDGEDV